MLYIIVEICHTSIDQRWPIVIIIEERRPPTEERCIYKEGTLLNSVWETLVLTLKNCRGDIRFHNLILSASDSNVSIRKSKGGAYGEIKIRSIQINLKK